MINKEKKLFFQNKSIYLWNKCKIKKPPVCEYKLLKYLGIPLKEFSLKPAHKNLQGSFAEISSFTDIDPSDRDNRIIWIYKNQSNNRKRFGIMHEVSHYIIPWHRILSNIHENIDRAKRLEREANYFAAELLIPQKWLQNDLRDDEISIGRLEELAYFYKVSTETMINKVINSQPTPQAALFITCNELQHGNGKVFVKYSIANKSFQDRYGFISNEVAGRPIYTIFRRMTVQDENRIEMTGNKLGLHHSVKLIANMKYSETGDQLICLVEPVI